MKGIFIVQVGAKIYVVKVGEDRFGEEQYGGREIHDIQLCSPPAKRHVTPLKAPLFKHLTAEEAMNGILQIDEAQSE